MRKTIVSWNDYQSMINELIEEIKQDNIKFDGVYGLPRGGLPIAVSVSHCLNLPVLLYPTNETLVVDDISDTGISLQNIKHKKILTLYNSLWTKTEPDYYNKMKISKNTWIVFPWEVEDTDQTTLEDFGI